jgi:arginine decarboxylase
MTGLSPRDTAAPARAGARPALRVPVVSGVGTGPTELAAFDAALVAAGIADRNLIRLSSVIPPGTVIERPTERIDAPGEWGDRLYVVIAESRTSQLHDRLAAGIGWVQETATGRGLFVEHEGHSRDEVETHIHDSLHALMRVRDVDFGQPHMLLADTVCDGPAACALVAAVVESAPWTGRTPDVIEL